MSGLLIVNADDFGLRPEVTDAIIESRRAGAITSATAMVHTPDAQRAAALAGEHGLPLGLHLNLTYPYPAADVPPAVRERQRRTVAYFGRRSRRWVYDPLARRAVDACISDQLEAFRATYGGEPTHIDGHTHIQSCPTVFLSPALGGVTRMRPSHTYRRGERGTGKRLVRGVVNGGLRRRFAAPDLFLSLRDLHPELGGVGLEEKLAIARSRAIEVMVHPAWPDERAVLAGQGWATTIAALPTGSYADLALSAPEPAATPRVG